tara:strand:+ start:1145 stop:1396 length:252 start_codon:yes stop_codon:yes gene_type:complete
MNKRVIVLFSNDGYEALYIDGKFEDSGNGLGEGDALLYMLKKSEEFNFKHSDVAIHSLTPEDNRRVEDYGDFLDNLNDYTYGY